MFFYLDIDECAGDEVLCSFECVNSEGSYECKCPEGYSRAADDKHCRVKDSSNLFMLLASGQHLLQVTSMNGEVPITCKNWSLTWMAIKTFRVKVLIFLASSVDVFEGGMEFLFLKIFWTIHIVLEILQNFVEMSAVCLISWAGRKRFRNCLFVSGNVWYCWMKVKYVGKFWNCEGRQKTPQDLKLVQSRLVRMSRRESRVR